MGLNFGRALVRGLVEGGKGYISQQQKQREMMQRYALVGLNAKLGMIRDQRQRQFEGQLRILEMKNEQVQKQRERLAKKDEQERYLESDEYQLKMDRLRAETEWYEKRSEVEGRKGKDQDDTIRKQKEDQLRWLDSQLQRLMVKSTNLENQTTFNVPEEFKGEFSRLKTERDRIAVELGYMRQQVSEQPKPTSLPYLIGDYGQPGLGQGVPQQPQGWQGGQPQGLPQQSDDPLGIRGQMYMNRFNSIKR